MNKKLICLLAAIVMALSCASSLAATMPDYAWYYATLNQRISSRTGPGTRYDTSAFTVNNIGAGATLRILSKAYDSPNSRWWVQTEITYQNRMYRVYTGEQRFNNLNLNSVPTEYQLGECNTGSLVVYDTYAGPGMQYQSMPSIPAYTRCTIWGYEENNSEDRDYIQVEYYDSGSGCYRRCWCAEWWMSDETMYYGWPGSQQSYPGGQSGYSSTQTSSWPVGTTCRVHSSSGNARSGPGTNYQQIGYVNQGQEFTILEVRMGTTGKDWYKVNGYFGTGWISSGLVTVWLNGVAYNNGTAYSWPIGN